MARLIGPLPCDCPLCMMEKVVKFMISIRAKKTRKMLREELMSGYMGPTYIVKWIMRYAKADGYSDGEYEYRIGEKGVWQS